MKSSALYCVVLLSLTTNLTTGDSDSRPKRIHISAHTDTTFEKHPDLERVQSLSDLSPAALLCRQAATRRLLTQPSPKHQIAKKPYKSPLAREKK